MHSLHKRDCVSAFNTAKTWSLGCGAWMDAAKSAELTLASEVVTAVATSAEVVATVNLAKASCT